MVCPQCGTNLPENARFCTQCGYKLHQEAPSQPQGTSYRQDEQQQTNTDTGNPKKSRAKLLGIGIAVALVSLFVAGCVTLATFWGTITRAGSHEPHPVTFIVSIKGYDDDSSRIPVSITGTDVDGNRVDKTIFLARSGVDVELVAGSYHAKVLGSPIASDGTIYQYPTDGIDFTIDADLKAGEEYRLPNAKAFFFYPLSSDKMTKELVDDALKWARKDEQSGADVGKLEEAAMSRLNGATKDEGTNTTQEQDNPNSTKETPA